MDPAYLKLIETGMVGVLCFMWIQVEKRHAAERKEIAAQFAKVLEDNTTALRKAAEAYSAWANHHCHCAGAEGCNTSPRRWGDER